ALVVMCTNRLSALDPAVRRRAAATFEFGRPNDEQRRSLLSSALGDLGFDRSHVEKLVAATGPRAPRDYGCTYSDIAQRFLPSLVLDAYPGQPIRPDRAIAIADAFIPTPPFTAESRPSAAGRHSA